MTYGDQSTILPHLFRTEYSKIVAVLYGSFRLKDLDIAEDIASETFLKAAEIWGIKGVPGNPTAWLYKVAKNKTKDYFKHNSVIQQQIKNVGNIDGIDDEYDFDFSKQNISDSQLSMIFMVCNPVNSAEAQICLALQILCGFSIEEIANAFLTNTETIKKRLLRARANLKEGNFQINILTPTEIKIRLDNVLKTLYLLFNEGYSSTTNNQLIRKDFCSEALRLTYILTENRFTNTSQTKALLAIMCFQSSRLDARINDQGDVMLFDNQDRSLWNQDLIEKGNSYLINAHVDHEISKYHLEATIAYWHTATIEKDKWPNILALYNQLILIEYSPITALNRTFAFSKVYGSQQAIPEAEKLNLKNSNQYYSLLGYLYAGIDAVKAIRNFEQAIELTKSKTEIQTLKKEITRLTGLNIH